MAMAVDAFGQRFKAGEFHGFLRPYDLERLAYVVDRSRFSMDIILSKRIDFSEQFIKSLDYDVSAYEEFLKSAEILKKSKNTLVPWSIYYGLLNASWNLELKAKVLENSRKDRVEVKVNTVDDNGNEIQKCFVWYAPYLRDDDQHKTKFDRLSTPTVDLLPPGKWNIWTEKDGKHGPKSPFSCGDDGRDKREIDILAPK
jgi:hypothetical protein